MNTDNICQIPTLAAEPRAVKLGEAEIRVPTAFIIDQDSRPGTALFDELETSGYQVITSNNGDQILEIVHQDKPDIIFADLQLLGLNGVDILSASIEVKPGAQFISITEDDPDGLDAAEEANENGALGYCNKPITLKEVKAVVRNAQRRQSLFLENQILVECISRLRADISEIAAPTAQAA